MSDTKKGGVNFPRLEGNLFVLEGATFGFAMTAASCEEQEGQSDSIFFRNGELLTNDSYLAMTYMNLGNIVRPIAG